MVLGLLAFPGLDLTAAGWLTLAWVAVLGLLATIPLGITLGSLIPDPRFIALIVLPFAGLTAISGIFYPITHLPGWLQAIGQVFPMYWLGLGMRAALLPGYLRSVELDGSWRLRLRPARAVPAGRRSGCSPRRRCCAGWRSASRGRRWPRGASARCCAGREETT